MPTPEETLKLMRDEIKKDVKLLRNAPPELWIVRAQLREYLALIRKGLK